MSTEDMMEPNPRLIEVDIEKEMKKSFLDYSMSVIVSRALPDVRDGLKPVHRRILYTMFENGIGPDKAYRKCADTVGSVSYTHLMFARRSAGAGMGGIAS